MIFIYPHSSPSLPSFIFRKKLRILVPIQIFFDILHQITITDELQMSAGHLLFYCIASICLEEEITNNVNNRFISVKFLAKVHKNNRIYAELKMTFDMEFFFYQF
jgi:hypothetical protein